MIEENITDQKPVRRRMMVQIYPEVVASLFRPGLFLECIKGFPPGTRVISIHPDSERHVIDIVIENDEFEAVIPGTQLPIFRPELRAYYGKELGVMRRMISNAKGYGEYEPPKAPDFSKMKESSYNLKADAERRFMKDFRDNFLQGHTYKADMAIAIFFISFLTAFFGIMIWASFK